jgi:hypothetical protein
MSRISPNAQQLGPASRYLAESIAHVKNVLIALKIMHKTLFSSFVNAELRNRE